MCENPLELEEQYQKALQASWRLLSYRPRGKQELRDRLVAKGFAVGVVEQVLSFLQSVGEVDDAAFSRLWVLSRESSKPMGRRRLQAELLAKGIPNTVIAEALVDYDETKEFALANQLVDKWRQKRGGKSDDLKELARLASWLQRRGFSGAVIAEICRDYRRELDE